MSVQGAIQQLTYPAWMRNAVAYSSPQAHEYRDYYLTSVEAVEKVLRGIFADPTTWEHLHGTRYWAIMEMTGLTPRWGSLVRSEGEEQQRHIDRLITRLQRLESWLSAAEGVMAVLDTNVLLHYQRPSQVPWLKVLGRKSVRLVLPLRVVEELDAKKYLDKDLAERARAILSDLWRLVGPKAGLPVGLEGMEHVTVEVPVDDEPCRRTLDADEEILNQCSELKGVGADVVLVTGDTGMSLRAANRDIPLVRLQDNYRRKRPGVVAGEPEGI